MKVLRTHWLQALTFVWGLMIIFASVKCRRIFDHTVNPEIVLFTGGRKRTVFSCGVAQP